MTVAEVINMLSVCYPTENVTVQSEAGRNMQILGIDEAASRTAGCVVLRTAWSYQDKVVESEEDKLKRQRDELTKQLAQMKREEKKPTTTPKKKTTRKKRKTTKKKTALAKELANAKEPTT